LRHWSAQLGRVMGGQLGRGQTGFKGGLRISLYLF
jgi:hypothetical protein